MQLAWKTWPQGVVAAGMHSVLRQTAHVSGAGASPFPAAAPSLPTLPVAAREAASCTSRPAAASSCAARRSGAVALMAGAGAGAGGRPRPPPSRSPRRLAAVAPSSSTVSATRDDARRDSGRRGGWDTRRPRRAPLAGQLWRHCGRPQRRPSECPPKGATPLAPGAQRAAPDHARFALGSPNKIGLQTPDYVGGS